MSSCQLTFPGVRSSLESGSELKPPASSSQSYFYSEKEMATHSSILAWRIPGMGEPSGLPSMGLHRVEHD